MTDNRENVDRIREDGERMARIEVHLETALKNQEESRERAHRMANDLMAIRGEHRLMNAKVDQALAIKESVDAIKGDIDAMQKAQQIAAAKRTTLIWLAKRAAMIAGAMFSAMWAAGDQIAKIAAFLGRL
jgi:hypothetical protein